MQNMIVSDNATQGISANADRVALDHVSAVYNGMTGIHSNGGDGLAVTNSVMSNNNAQNFNGSPAAAGIKVTRVNGLTISGNVVANNALTSGIWLDVSVVNFTIAKNQVSGNPMYGIITELSDTGIVAGNVVSGAKYGYTAFDTGNVKVYNNWMQDNSTWDIGMTQDARRNTESTKTICPWLVRNITVANNFFGNPSGGANAGYQVYALDKATYIPADSMNLVINGNLFVGESATRSAGMVAWGGSNLRITQIFTSPTDLATKNKSWVNTLSGASAALITPAIPSAITARGIPIPSDVAAALGVTTGSTRVGP